MWILILVILLQGYTDKINGSSSGAVINRYFKDHFPSAEKMGNESFTDDFKYKWMTHSWLVDVYLNCKDTIVNVDGPGFQSDLNCPTPEELNEFERAVRSGAITWHSFPFNAEPEMYTPELFEASLNITFKLDDYFGLKRKQSLSQRDVPGMTRNIIPLLNRHGIRLISVGENSQCAPVNVPPIFLWRDDESNTEVIAMFHGLGYGGSFPDRRRMLQRETCSYNNSTCMDDSNLTIYRDSNDNLIATDHFMKYDDGPGIHVEQNQRVVLNSRPGVELGEDRKNEACVSVKEAGVALCYAWKVDNSGPHSKLGVELIRDKIRILFPGAKQVASSSFDDFLERVWSVRDSLPIVNREIGDTWIMGASSDPLKVALFRSAQDAYSRCVRDQNNCGIERESLNTFVRLLTNAGEHTWGWNGGGIRRKDWTNTELEKARKSDPLYQTTERTWLEQRAFLRNALDALPQNSTLAAEIRKEWNEIENVVPFDSHGFVDVSLSAQNNSLICGESLILSLDVDDGSIQHVIAGSGKQFHSHLFRLHYQNLDHDEIEAYARDYIAGISEIYPDLAAENLVKPNMKLSSINSNFTLVRVRVNSDSKILLDLNVSNSDTHVLRGAPSRAQALLECGSDDLSYTLRWFNKTSTHAPETIWMSHGENDTINKTYLSKLGRMINAEDADLNCSGHRLTCGVHLHGVDRNGIRVSTNDNKSFDLISLDSALVSVGSANPLPTPLVVPDPSGGVHFALVGNIWNTNYPFWYPFRDADASSQFRFRVTFRDSAPPVHLKQY